MAAENTTNPGNSSIRSDLLMAASAWSVACVGLALGGKPAMIAVAVLALPMVAYLAVGHLAGRGGVMACLATALGMGMASAAPGGSPWAAVGLIGLVDLAAVVAGATAVRMAPARVVAVVASERPWSAIVVRHEAVAQGQANPFVAPMPALNSSRRRRSRGPAALNRSA